MSLRIFVNEWSNQVKTKKWLLQDRISFGQTNHLINLLNLVFPFQSPNVSSDSKGELPLGYHFLYNNPSNEKIGADGYDNYQAPVSPISGDSLFKRRMWVKGKIEILSSLPKFGENIDCEESITSVRSIGSSVFVNIQREFFVQDSLKFRELRTLMYTSEKLKARSNSFPKSIEYSSTQVIKLSKEEILKYSFLTYNLHKIHYDSLYCQFEEELPNVLVQGPFMVTLLMHWFKHIHPLVKVKSLSYKNTEPCFVDESLKLCCYKINSNEYQLSIIDENQSMLYIQGTVLV